MKLGIAKYAEIISNVHKKVKKTYYFLVLNVVQVW